MSDYKTFTSDEFRKKLKEFEGCDLRAYKCAAGVWTIGYGHTRDVKRGDRITEWYANDLLSDDISIAERQVLRLGVCKTQGQLDALVDFVFNLGIGNLKISTLLRYIQEGTHTREEIEHQFMRWVYARGQKLPGLIKRRQWEAKRFFEESEELVYNKENY